jgi:hypothetical protein
MKAIDLNNLELDPITSILLNSEKVITIVTGFICSFDETTISICENRSTDTFTIYPRSAIVSAFSEENKGCGKNAEPNRITFLVHAEAILKVVTTSPFSNIPLALRRKNDNGCGTQCQSADGWQKCCCGVGQRCVSRSGTCICEDASSYNGTDRNLYSSILGFNSNQNDNLNPKSNIVKNSDGLGQGYCLDKNGSPCPMVCRPVVIDGEVKQWYCVCECQRK